jgi:hypothetical protein
VNGESTMDASPLKNTQMGSTSSIFCLGILPTHHSAYQLLLGYKLAENSTSFMSMFTLTSTNCIAITGETTACGVN